MNKSFLKWAGGKSQSIEFIKDAIKIKPTRLVEPFVGSAVVSLNIDADEYLLADYNKDLIDIFVYLKESRHEFIKKCNNLFEGGNNKHVFYENRDYFNSLDYSPERSALFVYLNRHSFNGLCRYNSKGMFNVPFGKYKNIYFPKKEMEFFIEKSKKFQFKCCSFEEVFKEQSEGDVFYCDPPYIPLNMTASFTDYTDKGFPFEKQKELVKAAEQSKCMILISNHWIPEITEELYKRGDTDKRKYVNRSISAKGSSRGKVEEVLVIYNNINLRKGN